MDKGIPECIVIYEVPFWLGNCLERLQGNSQRIRMEPLSVDELRYYNCTNVQQHNLLKTIAVNMG